MHYRGDQRSSAEVYRDSDEGSKYEVEPAAGTTDAQWTFPPSTVGGARLAAALLYDFLGWQPYGDVVGDFRQTFVTTLSGDWTIPMDDVVAWWTKRQGNELVVFRTSNDPTSEGGWLTGFTEACHQAGYVTYAPFEGATALPTSLGARALVRADETSVASVIYLGADTNGQNYTNVVPADIALMTETGRRLTARHGARVAAAIDVDVADQRQAQEQLVRSVEALRTAVSPRA